MSTIVIKLLSLISVIGQPLYAFHPNLIANYTVNLIKSQHSIILGCDVEELVNIATALSSVNQVVFALDMNNSNFSLTSILTLKNHAKTLIILDCYCPQSKRVITLSSEKRYFNKTYQWFLWDIKNIGIHSIFDYVNNLGPNAQVSYVNRSSDKLRYNFYDVHSMGRHLKAPIEILLFAEWIETKKSLNFIVHKNVYQLQSIAYRRQFNCLLLRGGVVIDLDNIKTNKQIENILSNQIYDSIGVSDIVKYHYALLQFLREQFNFTVNFRNARGWAGRLSNTTFRLGLLGMIKRNEVDIAGSGAFNRINRFAEFDIIHQSYKFEAGFVYRYTPDIAIHNSNGNFLAPFVMQVWIIFAGTLLLINVSWTFIDYFNKRLEEKQNVKLSKGYDDDSSTVGTVLKCFAAVSQQGLDPMPVRLTSRTIALTVFLFSLIMYNYYTSSVVSGLLSNSGKGPETIEEIIESPLKLSFEDIGYHKVLLQERENPTIQRMYDVKILRKRDENELPVFTQIQKAIPIIKQGHYAFHCELATVYPMIAKLFNANEICDLRIVSGLLETEIINWIVSKNSQYTEIFRIMMCRVRESGLVDRTLKMHQPEKPRCKTLYTVYPVNLPSVASAFIILIGGFIISTIVLFIENILERCKKILNF